MSGKQPTRLFGSVLYGGLSGGRVGLKEMRRRRGTGRNTACQMLDESDASLIEALRQFGEQTLGERELAEAARRQAQEPAFGEGDQDETRDDSHGPGGRDGGPPAGAKPKQSPEEGPRGTHASKSSAADTSDARPALWRCAETLIGDVQDHAAQTAVSTDLSSSGPPGRRAGGRGLGLGHRSLRGARTRATALTRPAAGAKPLAGFVLRSSEVTEGGTLPKDYTGDGSAATLPLEWTGAPSGTRSFALIMHHVAPDMTKWYWVLYNIPADVSSLAKNVKGIGTLGNNSVNGELAYAPPHSKGPGREEVHVHAVRPVRRTEDHRARRGGQPRRGAGRHAGFHSGHCGTERDLLAW